MHLLQLNQSDDSEGETGGFKRRWLQGALQQQREHWQQRGGGVNHLQGDEEFTNHSASALIQQDLDQSLIHVVKPQVLTNPNLDACASARSTGQRREHGWAWAGVGAGRSGARDGHRERAEVWEACGMQRRPLVWRYECTSYVLQEAWRLAALTQP